MKILVAEDERAIAELYNLFLGSLGHDVLLTFDGEECLDVYEKHRNQTIDLVILDYRMPKKNGAEVAASIRSMAPDQRIVLATAFAHDLAIAEMKKESKTQSIEVIQKPFELDHLSAVVEKIGKTLARSGENKKENASLANAAATSNVTYGGMFVPHANSNTPSVDCYDGPPSSLDGADSLDGNNSSIAVDVSWDQ